MKFMHLSDLHLGRRINGFSMLEDQKYILQRILDIAAEIRPDGIILAGDIYDKPAPSAEAVILFDDFITDICKHGISLFVISGNHDSAERLSCGSRLLVSRSVYFSRAFCGEVHPITCGDVYGDVDIYLIPFIRPEQVRRFFPEYGISDTNGALQAMLEQIQINPSRRNVLVAHQFVAGAHTCDSEDITVGGLDGVDYRIFSGFDYAALGHLHGPQSIGRETVRYCGTPMKYSFSEAGQEKSITIVDLKEKGSIEISAIPLIPLRDLREIRGPIAKLLSPEVYSGTNTEDYLHVTLTDEEEMIDPLGKLRAVYKNIMRLDFDNTRSRNDSSEPFTATEQKTPHELFQDFYQLQNGKPMTELQLTLISEAMQEVWEEKS